MQGPGVGVWAEEIRHLGKRMVVGGDESLGASTGAVSTGFVAGVSSGGHTLFLPASLSLHLTKGLVTLGGPFLCPITLGIPSHPPDLLCFKKTNDKQTK